MMWLSYSDWSLPSIDAHTILIYEYLLMLCFSSRSHTCLIIFWLGILELMCINYLPIIYKKVKHNTYSKSDIKQFLNMNVIIFTLISSLLHKPHNIILNAGCILTCNLMSAAIDRQKDTGYNTFIKTIVHIWLGKVFYFYQVILWDQILNVNDLLIFFFLTGKLQ